MPGDFFVFVPREALTAPAENYSAAIRTSGAAARTSASTCLSNLAKFFWNMPTSLRAVSSNAGFVLPGLQRIEQMRLDARHRGRHREAEIRIGAELAFFSEPSSAPVTSARVTLIGMRRPTP